MIKTYTVREYPLKVEGTSGGYANYFSKGWHDREEFVEAANYEHDLDDWEGTFKPEDVKYEVWRCMPDPEGEYYMVYWPAQLGTPGAFPVTVVGQ